jgi:P pilus assembly chaperone PapD
MTMSARRHAALAACVLIGLVSVADGAGARTPAPTAPAPSNSTTYSTRPTAFSLTISPTRLVVDRDKIGERHRILVVNRGQASLTVTVQRRNFIGSPDGSLAFQQNAPYAAANWVTVSPSAFTIAPGRSTWVNLRIAVPAAPEAGDHQVALVFLVPAADTNANVHINRGVATPVYITVPGPTDNSASPRNLQAPGFSGGGRVTLTAKVHNTGNVHRDFRGTTPLRVRASGDAAVFPDFTVLRGATRDISTTWQPPLMCICHVGVTVANADGTSHTVSVRVIVFPVVPVLVILGALLVLLLLVFLLRRRYHATVERAAAALHHAGSGRDA